MNKTAEFLDTYLDAKRMATIDLMIATQRVGRGKDRKTSLSPVVYRAYMTVLEERQFARRAA